MTTLTQLDEQQSGKATTANANFDAVSPAGIFGRKAAGCSGLTWAYYGGFFLVEGSPSFIQNIPDGTLTLAQGNNFIEATTGGVVQLNNGSPQGFTSGKIPLYLVTVSGSTVTYSDRRMFKLQAHP